MLTTALIVDELFTPTFKRIVNSVWYMSSTPIVLCAEVDGLINNSLKMKKAKDSVTFSEVEHKH